MLSEIIGRKDKTMITGGKSQLTIYIKSGIFHINVILTRHQVKTKF